MIAVYALQGTLIAGIVGLAVERIRWLLYRAPVAEPFLLALERHCRAGEVKAARTLCERMPQSGAGRVAAAGLAHADGSDDQRDAAMEEELLDVRAYSLARLRAVRMCATLASTLGLLGAIVALVRGFGAAGLLALEAGLAQRLALQQALLIMGIGVATSAVCFSLFGMLRRAALEVLSQASRAARAVEAM